MKLNIKDNIKKLFLICLGVFGSYFAFVFIVTGFQILFKIDLSSIVKFSIETNFVLGIVCLVIGILSLFILVCICILWELINIKHKISKLEKKE